MMNDRKQHVINMAHQLFINKGFQATSIQDILQYSDISKGTFYNYFSSKNELFIELFKTINKKLENERNELLIGKDPSDLEIFIKQIEVNMKEYQKNKLFSFFGEVIYSNNEDLKQFVKQSQFIMLEWVTGRFKDIFGENKQPYFLDIAIMFMGILHHNLHFNCLAFSSNTKFHRVVRYSVERIQKMVDEVAETGDRLLEPEILERWLPNCQQKSFGFQSKIIQSILALKKTQNNEEEQPKFTELLDFVQEELVHSKTPRRFLIESAMHTLRVDQPSQCKKEFQMLEELVEVYFEQAEG
jgi:AcrR family transcriptional regulator